MMLAVVVQVSAAAVPAPRGCKGRPVLVVRRGTATAAVYRAPRGGAGLCARVGVGPNGVSDSSLASSESGARVPAEGIQVFWAGMSGNPGLVVLFGRVGASVTAVTIERSNHFAPEHARVGHGWYAVMWSGAPDKTHPTKVRITADSITRTYPLPPADRVGVPDCGGPQPENGTSCAGTGPGQTVGR